MLQTAQVPQSPKQEVHQLTALRLCCHRLLSILQVPATKKTSIATASPSGCIMTLFLFHKRLKSLQEYCSCKRRHLRTQATVVCFLWISVTGIYKMRIRKIGLSWGGATYSNTKSTTIPFSPIQFLCNPLRQKQSCGSQDCALRCHGNTNSLAQECIFTESNLGNLICLWV